MAMTAHRPLALLTLAWPADRADATEPRTFSGVWLRRLLRRDASLTAALAVGLPAAPERRDCTSIARWAGRRLGVANTASQRPPQA